MTLNRLIRSAAAALALAILSSGASASTEAWQRANDEYQAQRFANALAMYEQIAATGDARAAELAGHMLVLGEALYGESVKRDPARAARWLSQAASDGRPVAAHLLQRVNLDSSASLASQ